MDEIEQFEVALHGHLVQYLQERGELGVPLPDCPDVEGCWQAIGEAYLADGIREFEHYPVASLGWMMYVGMAVAQYWDCDWDSYGGIADLYGHVRDQRGYDELDEYVLRQVLQLHGDSLAGTEQLVGECASRTHTLLMRRHIEPGTAEALRAYVACLRQLYLAGAWVQLHRLGYQMVRLDS